MIFDHDSAGTMACRKPQSGWLAALAAILVCAAALMLVAPASADDGAPQARIVSQCTKSAAGA